MIPVYGFLEGDTLGTLIFAEEDETIAELASKVQQAARLRCVAIAEVAVLYQQRQLPLLWTVRQVGIEALERIDVVRAVPAQQQGVTGNEQE
jgi:hypothetical protein